MFLDICIVVDQRLPLSDRNFNQETNPITTERTVHLGSSNQQEMAKDGPITHGHKGSVQYVISCKTFTIYKTAI